MDNIADILSSLSSDDIDMLKGIADSILGENQSESENDSTPPPKQQAKQSSNPLDSLGLNLGMDDLSMIMKVKSAFERLNKEGTSSDNANLIMALKPHLSESRRNRADEALRLMKMMDMLPLLKELF